MADVGDCSAVMELIRGLKSDSFTDAEFRPVYAYNLEHAHVFVAEASGSVIGVSALDIRYHLHHGGMVAEITDFIVNEKYRGEGIGKTLLSTMENIARKAGCKDIEVASNMRRERAHHFYEGAGFVKTHYKLTKRLADSVA